METLVLILHVLVAIAMIGLILLQQGKGADMGASFGAGASQTVFGSAGSAGFLTKVTSTLAVIFFITSLALGIFARKQASQVEGVPVIPAATQAAPAPADVPAAPTSAVPQVGDVPAVPGK